MADKRAELLDAARSYAGISYRLDPPPDGVNSIDCSLLVVKAAHKARIPLPPGVRTAEQIRWASFPIGWDEVKPGDLLFFENTYNAGPPSSDGHIASHIGFSLGAGTKKMIDARERGASAVGETDISTPYWQERIFEARRLPALAVAEPVQPPPDRAGPDPWRRWTPELIATATQCPVDAVRSNWPRLVEQLAHCGITDDTSYLAMIGTIAIESASTFRPVREAFYLGEPEPAESHRRALRYYPYYGRGFIQNTWEANYRGLGPKIAALWGAGADDPTFDLVANPDNLLDADMSAAAAALYFRDHGGGALAKAAREGNWAEVRRLVLGGADPRGVARIQTIATALSSVPAPVDIPPPPPPPLPTPVTRADFDAALAPLLALRDRLPA